MNPYQIMGVITVCALLFAGVVALLVMQGMHVLSAFVFVYLVAIVCMLSMQRRARQACEWCNLSSQSASGGEFGAWQFSTSTNSFGLTDGDRRREHKFGV